jgi:LDH2 family malate/lactate/ureidoglycolate dehydrogenase
MANPTGQRVDPGVLRTWGTELLRKLGVPVNQAELVMDSLIDADLRGTYSHGSRLLVTYAPRVRAGHLASDTKVTVVRDVGAMALLDGGLGFGQIAAYQAVDLAAEKALTAGVAVVAVRETTHFGALGYFTARAARRGLLAIAAQNGPPMVPAFGGVTPLFATNPFSYAAPVANQDPLIFDIATTAVAGNKLQQVLARGETTIPNGWMTDREGRPTRDTLAATQGFLQWAGGHKGYGLGLLVETLAGVLADAPFGTAEHTRSPVSGRGRLAKGGTFVAIDPSVLLPEGVFAERMEALLAEVRSSVPAAGVDRVMAPGDLERELRDEQLRQGICLELSTVEQLSSLAVDLGVRTLQTA